jgi:ABC-type transport system involved in Fe-S cluster assembly fused permease/ATPase subunit
MVMIVVRSVPDYSLEKLRAAVAVVPQVAFVFSDTIRQYIEYCMVGGAQDRVEWAADVARLSETIA